MTIEQIGERMNEALVSVNNLLKYAKEAGIEVTMVLDRKSSTTEDVINHIQLKKLSQNNDIEFETKDKGSW